MMKFAMSRPAAALLRAILDRAGDGKNRILLSDYHSVEWQSLTFVGERHSLTLRIVGDDPRRLLQRLTGGIEDAEFAIPGHLVADLVVWGEPRDEEDGALSLTIEALTIAD